MQDCSFYRRASQRCQSPTNVFVQVDHTVQKGSFAVTSVRNLTLDKCNSTYVDLSYCEFLNKHFLCSARSRRIRVRGVTATT
jgi:hypothetical protein